MYLYYLENIFEGFVCEFSIQKQIIHLITADVKFNSLLQTNIHPQLLTNIYT